MRRGLLLVLVVALLPSGAAAPEAGGPETGGPEAALAFLRAKQGADGAVIDGWLSSWTALALAATRGDARDFASGGASLADYLAAHDAGYQPRGIAPLEAARAVVTVAALGEDPRAFGGTDHVARLLLHFDGRQFGAPAAFNDDMWAIFALRAAGYEPDAAPVAAAATYLLANQRADGGWGLTAAALPTTDETGWALNALALAGAHRDAVGAAAVERALGFLARERDPSGAFRQCGNPGCGGPNAESTAAALAALRALAAEDDARFAGAAAALASFQRSDGAYYRTSDSVSWSFATPQAIVALAGHGYPPARRFDPAAGVDEAPSLAPLRFRAAAARCEWRVDGETFEGCDATRVFPTPGRRVAALRAFATDGGYVRLALPFEVGNLAPEAALAAPEEAGKGRRVAFDALASRDPDGRVGAFRFDFGDGNATGWVREGLAAHAYARGGAFRAVVEVRDEAGAVASSARVVRVVNLAPALAVDLPGCRSGEAVRLSARANDPEGDAVSFAWDLGGAAASGPVVERAFPPGSTAVRVRAVDAEGAVAVAEATLVCSGRDEPAAPAPPRVEVPAPRTNAPPTIRLGPVDLERRVLRGGFSDDAPGVRVQLLLDGALVPVEAAEGAFFADLSRLPPGRHVAAARAVDADGASSDLARLEFTVPAEEPEAQAATPPRAAPAAALPLALLGAWAAAQARRARR